jgi:hypothetical protein
MNLDEPAENQQLLTLVDGLTSSALRSPRCGTGGIEEWRPPEWCSTGPVRASA